MSGICGSCWRDVARPASGPLALMTAALSLGAREEQARAIGPGAGVGVSSRLRAPQIYRGAALAVCDADLTNEAELAASAGLPESHRGGANTAALMAALYERLGVAFVDKLRGAFSVILWDERERRMVAAIDGFGIKRLAYYEDDDVLLIATRINALTATGEVPADVNPRAVANVLNFSCNLAPETIFTKIQRLGPGSVLERSGRATRISRYWDMRYGAENGADEARLSRELEACVERSVAEHCKADLVAELGAFLSGGTDSSTVVGLMTRTAKQSVNAFSIGFEDERFNELEYAKIAAARFHSRHHTWLVGPRECLAALPDILRYFDEPFGNSSAIPTYFCARLAAENGVKALLAGDGGDELFGGNERYATDKLFEVYHRIPRLLRTGLIEPIVTGLPNRGAIARGRRYIQRANIRGVERMLSYQFLRTHAPSDVFEGDVLRALGDYSVADIPAEHYAQAPGARDHLDRLLYVDMKITLADNDLPKVTCAAELAGIETRFPFLDRRVAEFSGRVPAQLKVKGLKKRYLFKRAFRELLPTEIIQKKKHGFGIPVANWMISDPAMREMARDTLLSSRALQRGYFRRQFMERLFHDHAADDSTYYGDTIWVLLALEMWHRQAVDSVAGVAL